MITEWTNEDLRELAQSWADEAKGDYDVEHGLNDLKDLKRDGEVFVLFHKHKLVGALGIIVLDTFFSAENYSAVRYWYIKPSYRYLALSLLNRAKEWSRKHNCAKILVCSNRLGEKADQFYLKLGFEPVETVYAGEL